MNLPNLITTIRFAIAPVFLGLLWDGRPSSLRIALVLYIIAGISDLLDGYVARKMNQESSFGRMADPFADKIIICGALIILIEKTPLLSGWMVAIIVCREFLVTYLRMLVETKGESFGSSFLGKQKMVIQFVAVGALIIYITVYGDRVNTPAAAWIQGLIWAVLASTLGSGALYVWRAVKVLRR
jgi:CDP-diacylglycerol--glycerol-3-phosphate 3-phosphatidyltransferase